MSILSTRKMICNKIDKQFDTLIQPIESAKGAIKTQINLAKAKLASMSFSSEEVINSAISDLESDVADMIPETNTEDIDEMLEFIEECSFLSENEMLKNPIPLLKGSVNSAIDQAGGFVFDLADMIPEFDAGKLVNNILNKFSAPDLKLPGALDISNVMQNLDKIIDCIAGRCGPDFSDRVTEMTDTLSDLYDELNIVSDPTSSDWGKFDINKIYDDVSLSTTERLQMNNVIESVKKSQSSITDSVGGVVDKIKGLL